MTIAQTILAQLGGNRFLAMTGAKNLVSHTEGGLSFKLAKIYNGISHVKIILDPSDTYTVSFMKWNARKLEMVTVSEHDGIYFDMLQTLFTEETGLYTSL